MEKWIDSEKQRPEVNSKIIFEDAIGMYWGTFYTEKSGVVYVQGSASDILNWEDIYRWIPYPKD